MKIKWTRNEDRRASIDRWLLKRVPLGPRAAVIPAPGERQPRGYGRLEQLASQKKVSLAWVVLDAVERYVKEHEDQMDQE